MMLRYCKSKQNGKLLYKSILEDSYQIKQVQEDGDETLTPSVPSTFRLQNEDELIETERKQVKADNQAIHIQLLDLPADVYAVVDSCDNANAMWHRIKRTPAPYALLAKKPQQTPYPSLVYTPKQPLSLNNIIVQQPLPNNNNHYMQQQPIIDIIIDVNEPMQDMQKEFALMSKAFTRKTQNVWNQIVGYNARKNGNQIFGNAQGIVAASLIGNNGNVQNVNLIKSYNCKGVGYYARNCTKKNMVKDSNYYPERLMLVQQEEAGIELTTEQHDILAYASDKERDNGEVNTNYYDSNIMAETPDVDFSGGKLTQHVVNHEKTNAYFESLLNNFKVELDRHVMVNQETKAENERLTAELAQYKGQQTFFEYNEQKYNELELVIGIMFIKQCLAK
ncbi:hypothetical protein Tco_0901854 [Tanacetum coccineum]